MQDVRIVPAGDTALVVEFGDRIERKLNNCVLALDRCVKAAGLDGVGETIPTFRSLMICFDPIVIPAQRLVEILNSLIEGLGPQAVPGRRWRLPACYAPELAPDLDEVAARTGISHARLVAMHCAATYHIYMLGFLPGQAYMGDVPAELALPRREAPRLRIPAGSLAIAATMTCIFPKETPCGWHLIGRSPVRLWENTPGAQALLAPGDTVTFVPVSLREYEQLAAKAAAGRLTIRPDNAAREAA